MTSDTVYLFVKTFEYISSVHFNPLLSVFLFFCLCVCVFFFLTSGWARFTRDTFCSIVLVALVVVPMLLRIFCFLLWRSKIVCLVSGGRPTCCCRRCLEGGVSALNGPEGRSISSGLFSWQQQPCGCQMVSVCELRGFIRGLLY